MTSQRVGVVKESRVEGQGVFDLSTFDSSTLDSLATSCWSGNGRNAAEAPAHKVQGGSFASSAGAVQGGGQDILSLDAICVL